MDNTTVNITIAGNDPRAALRAALAELNASGLAYALVSLARLDADERAAVLDTLDGVDGSEPDVVERAVTAAIIDVKRTRTGLPPRGG
ncbi:MAG: hypothetical protein R6U63_13805 [Longimicrobiales bacterium]